MHKRDVRDDGLKFSRGNGLPEVAGAGIPTLVFKDALPQNERPSVEKKVLEVALLWGDALRRSTTTTWPCTTDRG